jgi:cytoskeletal protein RodZ
MNDMQEAATKEIGSVLRSRRQEMGLSLEQVAERTKIRKAHLDALEEEAFDVLPGKVYVIGFLQNYARFLGIPAEPLLNALEERGYGKPKKEKHLHSSELMTAARAPSRKSPGRFLTWLILLLLLLAAAGFYYFSSYLTGNMESEDTLQPNSSVSQPGGNQAGADHPVVDAAAAQPDAEPAADPAPAVRPAAQAEASPGMPEEGATPKLQVEGEQ